MNIIIERCEDNVVIIDVAKSLYQKEAILFAAHKFTDRYYVDIVSSQGKYVSVTFRRKDTNLTSEDLASEFCNELLDQQVRLNIENSYGNIRDLIVKQAFQPVENIQNEIKI